MSHDKSLSNESHASSFKLKAVSLAVAALFLVTGFVMPVGAQPPSEPWEVQQGLEYLLDPDQCGSPPGFPAGEPYSTIKIALCALQGVNGNAYADDYLEQYLWLQNPVMDPGFSAAADGHNFSENQDAGDPSENNLYDLLPLWTVDPESSGSVSFDGGIADLNNGGVKQFFYNGNGVGSAGGAYHGIESISLDVDGAAGIYLTAYTTPFQGTDGKVQFRWDPVTDNGRVRLTAADAELVDPDGDFENFTARTGEGLGEFASQVTLSYLTIYDHNALGSTRIDNVVIDGTCFGPDRGTCYEFDSRRAFDGGQFQGFVAEQFTELNHGDQEAHDGYGIIIAPHDIDLGANDPSDPGTLDPEDVTVSFWFAPVLYTPSGPVPLDVDNGDFAGGSLWAYNASTFPESLVGTTGPEANLGSGAYGGIYALEYANAHPAFAEAEDWMGYTASFGIQTLLESGLVLGSSIFHNDALGGSDANLTSAYYDFEKPFEGVPADSFGFANEAKLLAPWNPINDQLDTVPTPLADWLALTAAGAAVAVIEEVIAATGCDGVCDLNDGWYHIIKPENYIPAPSLGSAEVAGDGFPNDEIIVLPDAEGYLNFHQQLWYQDSQTGAYGTLDLCRDGDLNPNTILHASLAFSQGFELATDNSFPVAPWGMSTGAGNGVILSTGNTAGVLQECDDDKDTIIHRIPVEVARAHGFQVMDDDSPEAFLVEPTAIWSNVWYKPRDDPGPFASGQDGLHSGGSATRTTGAGNGPVADCWAGTDRQDGLDHCPTSGGYMSLVKNALLEAALAGDPTTEPENNLGGNRGGAFIDLHEYALTPMTGILWGDMNNYLYIDTPAYPDCSDGSCVAAGPDGYGRLEPDANGEVTFFAMPYNSFGEPTGNPDTSDVDSILFWVTNETFPENGPSPAPFAHDGIVTSASDHGFTLGTSTDFQPTWNPTDGAWVLKVPRSALDQQFVNAGMAERGESTTFYVYAYAINGTNGIEGKSGAFNWEKNVAHFEGAAPVANLLNNVASPLQWNVSLYSVDVAPEDEDVNNIRVHGLPAATTPVLDVTTTNDGIYTETYSRSHAWSEASQTNFTVTGAAGPDVTLAPGAVAGPDQFTVSIDQAMDGATIALTYEATSTTPEYGSPRAHDSETYIFEAYIDTDGDQVRDSEDNCDGIGDGAPPGPNHPSHNPDQTDTDRDGFGDACDDDDNRVYNDFRPITFQRGHYGFGEWDDDTGLGLPADRLWWEFPVQGTAIDSDEAGIQSAWSIGVVVFANVTYHDGSVEWFALSEDDYEATGIITHLGTGDVLSGIPLDDCNTNGASVSGIDEDGDGLYDYGPVGIYGREDPFADPLAFTTHGGCSAYIWDNVPGHDPGFDPTWAARHPGLVEIQAVVEVTLTDGNCGSRDGCGTYSDAYDLPEYVAPALGGAQPSGFDEQPTPVLILNGALDADGDGFPTLTELNLRSSPTNPHSTPYSDDDHDGLKNYRDSTPMIGSQNGADVPNSAVFGDTGELLAWEYLVDIENWLGQDITLTTGTASVDVKPVYQGGVHTAYRFELRGARISEAMTSVGYLCIGADPVNGGGGTGVVACHDGTNAFASVQQGSPDTYAGDGAADGNVLDAGIEDGKLFFVLSKDATGSGNMFINMSSNAADGSSTGEGYSGYLFGSSAE